MSLDNTPIQSISVNQALDNFIQRWCRDKQQHEPQALTIDFDSQYLSSCYVDGEHKAHGEVCQWRPVKQPAQDMFARLASALEITIHPDIVQYYTRYWSNHLSAKCHDGELELLQVWNQDDMERLRSNLLGHALDKKKRKHSLTFFFAVTSPEDGMLCIDNETGAVWYELPGKKPQRKIADSLASFIDQLQP